MLCHQNSTCIVPLTHKYGISQHECPYAYKHNYTGDDYNDSSAYDDFDWENQMTVVTKHMEVLS